MKGVNKMKKSELEQNLIFAEKRILELGERIVALTNENEKMHSLIGELKNENATLNDQMSRRIKALSDELYQYIGNQNQQLSGYIDMLKQECDNKTSNLSDELYRHISNQNKQLSDYVDTLKQESDNKDSCLSDELYQHISNQNKIRDNALAEYKKQINDELWMRTFGFDNMISELQLAMVEKEIPGNRSKLETLKDSHKGEKCFVIGNGPSLNKEDLDNLKHNNIFCFASKGIFNIFDETDWRPDVWAASDLGHIASNKDKISKMDGMIKLLCAQTITKIGASIKDVIYFPFIQVERKPPFFNQDVTRGVHFWGTVTCKLINFAVYMGFEEIYLLGVDNQYGIKKDETGKYVYDTSAKNHFSEEYLTSEEKKECERTIDNMVNALEYVNLSYETVKWHCDNLGVKIFNATRGGKLEIFPRVDIDNLLK